MLRIDYCSMRLPRFGVIFAHAHAVVPRPFPLPRKAWERGYVDTRSAQRISSTHVCTREPTCSALRSKRTSIGGRDSLQLRDVSWVNISWFASLPRKPRKYYPSKITRYTVYTHVHIHVPIPGAHEGRRSEGASNYT